MKHTAFVFCLLGLGSIIHAQGLPVGTWVKRQPEVSTRMNMTVEAVGTGQRITYRLVGPNGPTPDFVMTILTQLDGKDAPLVVNGKPSGETMGIRMIDGRHTTSVIKVDGKDVGTSKSEVSADGKVLKIENTALPAAQGKLETGVEYWDKK